MLNLLPLVPAVNFDLKSSLLLWLVYVLMGLSLIYNRHTYLKQRIFLFAWLSILRGLVTLGVQPTLFIMGLAQVGVANIETTLFIMGLLLVGVANIEEVLPTLLTMGLAYRSS